MLLTAVETQSSGFTRTIAQVLHGCRQLVSWDVWLSPLTSATLVVSCYHFGEHSGETARETGRKVGMTSNHHGPYVQGYTRVTMASTEGCYPARVCQSHKAGLSSDWGLQLDLMKLKSLVIAHQIRRGEYVLGPCTHRPSHHESCLYPKLS